VQWSRSETFIVPGSVFEPDGFSSFDVFLEQEPNSRTAGYGEPLLQTVRPVARSLRGWTGEAANRSKPSDNAPTLVGVAPKP
jgi:hypothetical protein